MLVVVNVDEKDVGLADLSGFGLKLGSAARAVVVSAPIEQEISRLEPAEQQAFLADLGLPEPSLDRLVRASYELLGYISFFTVGEDEVRAWTIRRGTPAVEAAGTIHSDIQRGFIRAEVVFWEELARLKTLAACRDQGLLRLEGKEYVMRDGDVAHFRFNV
jgi:ribosome-binding ATPase YchF (GTP1/OBG family)